MVATMVRLLQVAREILPWWWPYPLIIGSILFIGALLLLVPQRWWGRINYLRWRLPRWFHATCMWILYAPRCIIDELVISRRLLQTDGSYDARYTATIDVHIKNRGKPLKVDLSSAKVCLEQRTGWEQQIVQLRLETHRGIPEIRLEPWGTGDYEVEVSTIYRGSRPEAFPDPENKKDCRRGYQGIYVALPRGLRRELHKGLYCKPVREYHVGIV